MSSKDVLETLRDVGFLHDFAEDYLRPIAAISTIMDFPTGFVLFREGESASERLSGDSGGRSPGDPGLRRRSSSGSRP